jgi:lysine N6-hydroxylase
VSAPLDYVGIGLGPFNLGLAALADPLDDVEGVVLETGPEFSWHPGMLLPESTLQTPFLSDLTTLADPTSRYTFLNWLKLTGRLYPFYIRESFYPLRTEYDDYCRWVAEQLPGLRYGRHVESVEGPDAGCWRVTARHGEESETYRARHVVMGIGTAPSVPPPMHGVGGDAVHSEDYLAARDALRAKQRVVVLGSGQSAAEIYLDLLTDARKAGREVWWVTRSARFFPLELAKLTLELTSPEYTDYVHALPEKTRDELLPTQAGLYKGINESTIDAIHETLYRLSRTGPVPTRLLTGCELAEAGYDDGSYRLGLHHAEQDRSFDLETDGLVLATGYRERSQAFLDPLGDRIARDHAGRLAVERDFSVPVRGSGDARLFVQNAEGHTHGFTAHDLGMAAHRNSWILRAIAGRDVYPVERRIGFQDFGVPGSTRTEVFG